MNNRSIDEEINIILIRDVSKLTMKLEDSDRICQQIKSLIGKRLLVELDKTREIGTDKKKFSYIDWIKVRRVFKDVLNID